MTAAPTPANGSRRKPWGELAQPSGFTLLEILVALVVLGLLMIGLTEGTRLGLRTIETQARLTDRTAGLDAVDQTLRTLIGGLYGARGRAGSAAGGRHRVGTHLQRGSRKARSGVAIRGYRTWS